MSKQHAYAALCLFPWFLVQTLSNYFRLAQQVSIHCLIFKAWFQNGIGNKKKSYLEVSEFASI